MKNFRFSLSSGFNDSPKVKAFSLTTIIFSVLIVFMSTGCKKESYTLTLTANPADAGTFTTIPEITGPVTEGTVVSVTQQPSEGYYLSEWTGDAEGNDDAIEIVMDGNKNIVAEYLIAVNESFDDGNADGFTDDATSRWATNDTAYVMTGSKTSIWAYSGYDINTLDNFELSVDIIIADLNLNSGNPAGIFFRSQVANPQTNAYWVMLNNEGKWYLLREVEGMYSFIQSWIECSDLNAGLGSKNNLKVICSGSTIEVVINGVSQGSFTDENFSSGYVGLIGYDDSSYQNIFIFDNFSVKQISAVDTKSAVVTTVPTEESNQTGDPRFN